ncbi:MAG TPA: putative dsRNA-binding protein, partial [bacterium]|nr:putative dsRNA-binding protein [bacterium]
ADFVERYFEMIFAGIAKEIVFRDYKTRLQEAAQARLQATPNYQVVDASGPDHERSFTVEVSLRNRLYGSGVGRSKKQAEQMAAKQALQRLHEEAEEKTT